MAETEAAAVKFDFEGSLKLARELWTFSELLKNNAKNLETLAETLAKTWTGTFATEFSKKIEAETTEAKKLALGLQGTANRWAAKWKQATDLKNKADRETKVRELSSQGLDMTYANSQIPPVPVVLIPQPPTYTPT